MNRWGKILAIVAGAVVGLVVVLIVLAQVLITPERVRETVLPLAKEALHREVALGDIEVSLFSGITLKDLRVRERGGEEDFLAADRLVLRYRLWPLLFLRVEVDEVRLDGPKIRVERFADASFNFSDLMAGSEGETGAPQAAPSPGKEKGIDLLVSRVAITGGDILFLDHAAGAPSPYRYQLRDLALQASDISLERSFPFSASARINGSSLTLEGEANAAAESGKVKVGLADLDVTAFAPYYRDVLPGTLGSLKLGLDAEVAAGGTKISSQGSVKLEDLDLVLDAMKESPLSGAALRIDYGVAVDLEGKSLALAPSRVVFNGITAEAEGTVSHFDATPLLDLKVALPGLDLRGALASLPKKLVAPAADLDPAGTVDVRVHLAGTPEDPVKLLKDASATLTGVEVSAGGMRPALTGRIDLQGESVQGEKLQLKIGDNLILIDLAAKNILGAVPEVTTRISADRLLIDPLLGSDQVPAAGPGAAKGTAATQEEIGPLAIPLRADGEVRVKQALYKGLTIDSLALDWQLVKNVLTVDRLTGNLAGGSFKETARVDLGKKGLDYSTSLEISGVQADPLVSAFAPSSAGTLFGALDLAATIDGRGTLPEPLKKNLSGKGHFRVADARLTGSGIARGLSDYLQLEELRDVRFSKAEGDFTVENGRVKLAADFGGSKLRLSPRGSAGLDGSLDLVLDTRLSPELTKKLDGHGKISGYFKDDQGWGQLPLKVKGTASSPRFTLDTSAVKGQVKEKAVEQLQKALEKKLFKKQPPAEPGAPATQDPAKKALDDALKGLFGR